ncbi:MAG TPA: biopolymer transporter ExbD [Kofleriaceae bacterium]|nr:biopolymer transporter ExbD [Kofleriaceae bacterium]
MASTARHNRRRLVHKAPPKLDSVRNEINVTPLVDVCLVLLIIFMVILPMLSRGKEVPLPQTQHHAEDKDTRQPIVAIDEFGKLYVDKEEVPDLEAMKARVKDEWKALEAQNLALGADADRSGEGRVLIKAHEKAHYKAIYPVIIALHDIGAHGIDLGTNEIDEKGD